MLASAGRRPTIPGMNRTGVLLAVAASILALAGCTGQPASTASRPAATVTVTATPTATVTVTTIPDAPPTTAPTAPRRPRLFPRGYPKVVTVSSLPEQVRSAYAGQYAKAVALAPGVWTPLAPGATVKDAATSGVADGFCGSIKTFERKYRHGEALGGSCW